MPPYLRHLPNYAELRRLISETRAIRRVPETSAFHGVLLLLLPLPISLSRARDPFSHNRWYTRRTTQTHIDRLGILVAEGGIAKKQPPLFIPRSFRLSCFTRRARSRAGERVVNSWRVSLH